MTAPHRTLQPSTRPLGLAIFLALEALALLMLGYFADLRVAGNPLWFTVAGLAAGAPYFMAVHFLGGLESRRAAWATVWAGAILFRLLLMPAEPGDDLWRYLWEGLIQGQGHNPYTTAPSAEALAALREAYPGIISQVGHPEWRAIYPPATELVFAGLAAISPSVLVFKLCFTLADLGVLAVIMLGWRGRPGILVAAAFYAWNPLVIHSFAGAGHYDSLMILPLVGAAWLLLRSWPEPEVGKTAPPTWRELFQSGPVTWSAALGIALLLGLAVAIKLAPLALLPVFALALGRKAVALALSLLPVPLLALFYGFPGVPVWESFQAFNHVSRTNALVWWVTEHVWYPGGDNALYNRAMLLAALAGALWGWWRRDPLLGLLTASGALLIFSHTLHPWYLTWLLPFAVLRGSRPWLVGSVSIFAYFLLWADTPFWRAWEMHPLIWALQVLPPVLFVVGSGLMARLGARRSSG